MSGYMTLLGAEEVGTAGRSISGAPDQMERAAMSIDNGMERAARVIDEAAMRVLALAEQQATDTPTLRDLFAAKAMALQPWHDPDDCFANHADRCYVMADAMLKARAA